MLKIAPSLLAADFLHLADDIERVQHSADLLHLDVMDGIFVPNISFGFPIIEAVARQSRIAMDVHLMIAHPEQYISRLAETGATMISFHYEAAQSGTAALIRQIQHHGIRAGVAINPDAPIELLDPYLDDADFFLIMSVFAGFGGQKFIPESLDRIAALRRRLIERGCGDKAIEVDGGVGPENAAALVQAGASILVAGSSIFHAPNPEAAIDEMRYKI